jgi:hypothetical protein
MSFPTAQRLRQVYVEIPPSPLHTSARTLDNAHLGSSSQARTVSNHNLKENAPFRHRHDSLSQANPHVSLASSHKRKLSDMSPSAQPSKKTKADAPEGAEAKATPELLSCHQCNRKREPSGKYIDL